jgi:hypothetical protein
MKKSASVKSKKNASRKTTRLTKVSKTRVTKNKGYKSNSVTKTWLDVHHEHHFHSNDGQILKNVSELPAAIRNMPNESFLHHVNSEKNDFATWVEHAVSEPKLAASLRKVSSKTATVKTLRKNL